MKRMKAMLTGLLLVTVMISGKSQLYAEGDDEVSKVGIFAEGLGPGLLGSLNLSYRFIKPLAVNVGVGYTTFSVTAGGTTADFTITAIPVYASFLLGSKHSLEVLAGVDLLLAEVSSSISSGGSTFGFSATGQYTLLLFGAGYRYWPHPGLLFRITGYGLMYEGTMTPTAGISLGYGF